MDNYGMLFVCVLKDLDRFSFSGQVKMESPHEKTCLTGFRPCLTQTRLYSHRRWLRGFKLQI